MQSSSKPSLAFELHKLIIVMDRAADEMLRENFQLSYQRAYFLLMLWRHGNISQHKLATLLGYRDASVSTMLTELVKEGYVVVKSDPEHGRKKLVSLTPKGNDTVIRASSLLDAEFAKMVISAKVDTKQYTKSTNNLYEALVIKTKGKKS